MKTGLLISIILSFSLSACSTPILRTTYPPTEASEPTIGVIYYLPKGLIPLSISIDEVSKKSGGDDENPSGNNSPSVVNTVNINNTNSQKPLPPPGPKNEGDGKNGVANGKEEAPSKKYAANISIGDPKIVPDLRFPYFLEYNPSIGTDDEVIIGVGSNQLLQTTTSKSTDQTGAFLGTLAQIAAEALKLTVAFDVHHGKPPEAKPGVDCSPLVPMKLSTYLDPTPESNSNFSQAYITEKFLLNTPIKIKITQVHGASNVTPGYCIAPSKEGVCSDKKTGEGIHSTGSLFKGTGVLFRSLALYSITITVDPEKEMVDKKPWCLGAQSRTFTVMAPNDGHIFAVDVSRTRLVQKKTNLTIVDGMLTQIDLNKPSSLLAGAKIPLDIIKAIASIPNDILTLRIKRIQDEGSLTKAQGDLLLNEIQRLKNENLLQQQRNVVPSK